MNFLKLTTEKLYPHKIKYSIQSYKPYKVSNMYYEFCAIDHFLLITDLILKRTHIQTLKAPDGLGCCPGAAVRSNAEVLLLLICYLVCFSLVMRVLCLSLFCCALLCVLSSFAIFLKRKRELVALLLLSDRCPVTVNVQ